MRRKAKVCKVCGKPAFRGCLCRKHLNEYMIKKQAEYKKRTHWHRFDDYENEFANDWIDTEKQATADRIHYEIEILKMSGYDIRAKEGNPKYISAAVADEILNGTI